MGLPATRLNTLLSGECLSQGPLFQRPSVRTIPGRTLSTPPAVHCLCAGERSGEQGLKNTPTGATQTQAGENALANPFPGCVNADSSPLFTPGRKPSSPAVGVAAV